MATAELAMVIPAILLVLAMCVTGLSLGADQIRCVDAARAAARAASRGEPTGDVRRLAQALAPSGSQVQVDLDAGRGQVRVTVRAPERARMLPSLPAPSATASAPLEPVVDTDP